jgi:hypothetical protein
VFSELIKQLWGYGEAGKRNKNIDQVLGESSDNGVYRNFMQF